MKIIFKNYVKIPFLIITIGFLFYGIQSDTVVLTFTSNEVFAANEYHIPTFKNSDVSVSSNTKLKLKNLDTDEINKIPLEINAKMLREVKVIHIEKMLNELDEITSTKGLKEYSNNELKKTIKEIKKNVLEGKDYGAIKKLYELKSQIEHSENKKHLSKFLDKINALDSSLIDKNKPIKDKKFLQNPKKQHESNIPFDLLECKHSLKIIIKENTGEPACVQKPTIQKLIERGWGYEYLFLK